MPNLEERAYTLTFAPHQMVAAPRAAGAASLIAQTYAPANTHNDLSSSYPAPTGHQPIHRSFVEDLPFPIIMTGQEKNRQ